MGFFGAKKSAVAFSERYLTLSNLKPRLIGRLFFKLGFKV